MIQLITQHVTIKNNSTDGVGGGIFSNNSQSNSQYVIITDNSAGLYGGGIYVFGGSNLSMTNLTLSMNQAFVVGGIALDNSSLTLANSVVWNNNTTAPGQPDNLAGMGDVQLSITYSDIQGGFTHSL